VTPALIGKSTARPAMVVPNRSGRSSVVAGPVPLKNRYCSTKLSGEVTVRVCDWPLRKTLVAPAMARVVGPSPQMASVGTPPGGAAADAPSRFT
jgi:hypothetical protein